jgi:hypothetical protein
VLAVAGARQQQQQQQQQRRLLHLEGLWFRTVTLRCCLPRCCTSCSPPVCSCGCKANSVL